MKKLKLLLTVICLLLLAGCSDNSSDNKESSLTSNDSVSNTAPATESEISQSSNESSGISFLTDIKTTPTTSSSSITSPLGLNEWGMASKYCRSTKSYVNVPVRILSVKRGNEAAEEIKELGGYLLDNNESEEYAIAEYEICLNGFPSGEHGTWCDISGTVSDVNGSFIKLDDGSYWSTSINFFVEDKSFYYEGIVRSKVYYNIIKDRTDYLLCIGETGETVAYFKPE